MSQTQGSMVLSFATEYSERLFPNKDKDQTTEERTIQKNFEELGELADKLYQISNGIQNMNSTKSKSTSIISDDKDLLSEANSLTRKVSSLLSDFEGQIETVYGNAYMSSQSDKNKIHYIKIKTILLHKFDVIKRSLNIIVRFEEKNINELKDKRQSQIDLIKGKVSNSYTDVNNKDEIKLKHNSYFDNSMSFSDSEANDDSSIQSANAIPVSKSIKFELETMEALEKNINDKIAKISDVINASEEIYNLQHPKRYCEDNSKAIDDEEDSSVDIKNERSWKIFSVLVLTVVIILLALVFIVPFLLNQ